MKTNVQPGMLAYVAASKYGKARTPEIIGRIVFVERAISPEDVFKHIDGRAMRNDFRTQGPVWVISAKEPLPAWVTLPGLTGEVWYLYERPMVDECLRPLIDPDIDVSDEEVKELYSVKPRELEEV
jgi:hypothetical protein